MTYPWERATKPDPNETGEVADFTKRKVLVGIPHQDFTTVQWAVNFARLHKPPNWGIGLVRGYPIDTARNIICECVAADKSITDVIFLDSDVCPIQRNALLQLLAYEGAPIISGIYMSKQVAARWPAAWIRDPVTQDFSPITLDQKSRFIQVDVIGAGFCRIDAELLRKMTPPWFDFRNGRYGPDGKKLQNAHSEDFEFCRSAEKQCGVKPVVDMELRAHHVGFFWALGNGALDTLGVEPSTDMSVRTPLPGEETKAEIRWVDGNAVDVTPKDAEKKEGT